MYIMQSVHASKVVSHMNKMYGDFGKFTESPKGNIKFEPIVEISNHSQVATEIKVYASGYNAALDEAAAPELLDALESLVTSLDPDKLSKMAKQTGYTVELFLIARESARAAIAKAKGNKP